MFDDVIDLLEATCAFREEAENILSRHETSVTRVVSLESTLQQIESLNLKQEGLLKEAIECIQNALFRAAYVMSWAAMADYLQEWLVSDKMGNLARVRPKWETTTAKKLRESANEYQIIETLRACGYITRDTMQALHGLLKRRNMCAHPTDYRPDLNMTIGFVSEILHWFQTFEKDM
ncbi:MAG: hypothetical protein ACTSPE_05710 [Candidatus Thorarchaeota archaeon]